MFEKPISFLKKIFTQKEQEDFTEKLKDSKNPFLGTLSLIWVIRNWQIVYAIFFDNREFLVRLEFIKSRIYATTFSEILLQFAINVGLAILAVVVIYLLIYLTRFITNKFENRLLPWIYKISSVGKIVLKTELDKVEKEKAKLEKKLKVEKEKRLEAEAEVDLLEREKGERLIENLTASSKADDDLNKSKTRKLFKDSEVIEIDFSTTEQKLVSKYGGDKIFYVLDLILKNNEIFANTEYSEIADTLEKFDLIVPDLSSKDGILYKMNQRGKTLWKKLYK